MEKQNKMEYGKKYVIGNFVVLKYNKVLRKSEVAEYMNTVGLPAELRGFLERSTMPYIKVKSQNGLWGIEFCYGTGVYHTLDNHVAEGGKNNDAIFGHLFNMWYVDTTCPGDDEYQKAKADAIEAFIERSEARKKDNATIVDMKKGGSNED